MSQPVPHPARELRRVPLAAAAGAMAAGILAGRFLTGSFGIGSSFYAVGSAASFVFAVALAIWATRRADMHTPACVAAGATIFFLAAAHLHQAYYTVPADHVVTYTGLRASFATVRGRIVTSPMHYARSSGHGYRGEQTGFLLDCSAIRTADGWADAAGWLRVTIREPAEHLAAGQDVELVGTIGRFRPPLNPGQRDRAATARLNRTPAWMTVPCAGGAVVLSGDQPWYTRAYWNVRAAARQHLGELGDEDDACVLRALVVGERDPAIAELNRTMVRAGVAHFLSISGLHLGVFLGFVYGVCRLCALTPRRGALVVLGVLAAYVLLAEPRAPLLRSAIMAAALCLAAIWRRRYCAANALAAAAIVLLMIDPLQLFMPGFQLSFAIVAALVTLHRPVRSALFGRWLRQRGLTVFRTDQPVRRWLSFALANRLMDAVTLALLAYATAAPLVAYHFGLFSPYAAPLSLLLLPLVAAVLVPGYISVALLGAMPGLSYTVGRAATAAAGGLARAVAALDALPALSLELRPVSPWWVIACYAALLAVLLARQLPLGRLLAGGAMTVCVAWTLMAQWPAARPIAAELHLLAVGNGQCAVLRAPSGRTYMLDAGTQGGYDAHASVIAPLLRAMRLPAPREAFISHANTDHYNALPAMLSAGDLRRVYLNPYFGTDAPSPSLNESTAASFMFALADAGTELVRLEAGQSVMLDDRTRVEVLWPRAGEREQWSVNDTSLVLRITCDGKSVLLPGDLDAPGQTALLRSGQVLACDVLVLPHHGGWEESLSAFFDAVDPQIVLVSGRGGPHVELLPAPGETAQSPAEQRKVEFYRRIGTTRRCYTTGRDGWIRVRFGRGEVSVVTMR